MAGTDADLRGLHTTWPALYRPDDDTPSRTFGTRLRHTPLTGIAYTRLRDPTGTNLTTLHPRAVQNVTQATHLELTVRPTGKIIVRAL